MKSKNRFLLTVRWEISMYLSLPAMVTGTNSVCYMYDDGDLGNTILKRGVVYRDMTDRADEVGFDTKDLKTAGERNVINGWIDFAKDELTGKYLPESAFSKAMDVIGQPDQVKSLTGSTVKEHVKMVNDLFKQIKEMMLNGAKKMQYGSF